jgi:hypothetical protein
MTSPDKPQSRKQRGPGARERRALPGRQGMFGAVRRLHALMTRPFKLQWANGSLRLSFVERRQGEERAVARAPARPVDPMAALRAELRARLLQFAPQDAAQVMHHLLLVDQELGRKGWAGVESLPAPVLAQALVQAQRLVKEQPSDAVSTVIERLRPLLTAADQRVQRDARQRDAVNGTQLEVSEATGEDFEASERSWFGDLAQPKPAGDAAQTPAKPG